MGKNKSVANNKNRKKKSATKKTGDTNKKKNKVVAEKKAVVADDKMCKGQAQTTCAYCKEITGDFTAVQSHMIRCPSKKPVVEAKLGGPVKSRQQKKK